MVECLDTAAPMGPMPILHCICPKFWWVLLSSSCRHRQAILQLNASRMSSVTSMCLSLHVYMELSHNRLDSALGIKAASTTITHTATLGFSGHTARPLLVRVRLAILMYHPQIAMPSLLIDRLPEHRRWLPLQLTNQPQKHKRGKREGSSNTAIQYKAIPYSYVNSRTVMYRGV